MKKLYLYFILALTLTACTANKKDQLAHEFSYEGRPIDPWCINLLQNPSSISIPLTQCSLPQTYIKISKQVNPELQSQGFIGYSYKYINDTPVMSEPYIYYKYLGKVGNLHVINRISCNGKSGKYSEVVLIKRKGDTLTLVNGYGGDRCSGSIVEAKVENDKVKYTMQLTPLNFVLNSPNMPYNYYVNQSLANCATCCYMTGDFIDGDMVSVKLNPAVQSSLLNSQSNNMQRCFDNIFQRYIKSNKLVLNSTEISKFVDEFSSKCLKYKH